jgi:cell division protein FtsB
MVVFQARVLRLCFFGLVLALGAWGFFASRRELLEARREWEALQARREALAQRVRQLQREVGSLQADKESRARAARELLGVCGKGEVVVILPTPQGQR